MRHVLLLQGCLLEGLLAPFCEIIAAAMVTPGEARALLAAHGVAAKLLSARVATWLSGTFRPMAAWRATLARGIVIQQAAAEAHDELVIRQLCLLAPRWP